MKLTSLKSMVTRSLAFGLIAGAVVFVTPKEAHAQSFGVAVQFGQPEYRGPVYAPAYGPGFYDRGRGEQWRAREDWRRHEEWARREQWERERAFHERHEEFGYRGYPGR